MTSNPVHRAPASRGTTPRSGAPRRRGALAVAATAAVLLTLGACSTSGGDDAADQAKPTSTTDAPATTTTAAAQPDETTTTLADDVEEVDDPVEIDDAELDDAQDRVERINLTIDDLPDGWTAEPSDDDEGSVVDECSTHGGEPDVVAKAASDSFTLVSEAGMLGLDTTSGYLQSEATAEDLMADLGSDDFAVCATDAVLDTDEVTIDGELMTVDGMPELGDEVTALQGDFSLSDDSGETAQLSVIMVAIRTDQVITTVSATAMNTPGDESLLYEVLDTIAERQEL